MKRVVSLILALCIGLIFCACSGNKGNGRTGDTDNPKETVKATIVDNEGNTVQMSSNELCKIHKENAANYKTKYFGAEATISGTVEKVELGTFDTCPGYVIHLQEGWEVMVGQVEHPEVADFSTGTKIQISAVLEYPENGIAKMAGMLAAGDYKYRDVATIQVIK